jgi:cytochrome c-type biogenesis protein CcmF
LLGVGPLVAWRKASPASLRRQFKWPVSIGLSVTLVLGVIFWGRVGYWALSTWGLCAFVAGTIGQEYAQAIRARVRLHGESVVAAFMTLMRKNQRRYGGYIIHLGVVVMLLGISGSVFNYEALENMDPGDSVDIQDYRLEYLTANPITQQHYGGATARLALFREEQPLAVMEPQKRIYWLEDQPSTIPSIYSTWSEDIYVILNAIETDGSATIKIYLNPLVNWIWAGAILFALGGVSILWPHPPRPAAGQGA